MNYDKTQLIRAALIPRAVITWPILACLIVAALQMLIGILLRLCNLRSHLE